MQLYNIINRKEVFLKNSLKMEYREKDSDKVYRMSEMTQKSLK